MVRREDNLLILLISSQREERKCTLGAERRKVDTCIFVGTTTLYHEGTKHPSVL